MACESVPLSHHAEFEPFPPSLPLHARRTTVMVSSPPPPFMGMPATPFHKPCGGTRAISPLSLLPPVPPKKKTDKYFFFFLLPLTRQCNQTMELAVAYAFPRAHTSALLHPPTHTLWLASTEFHLTCPPMPATCAQKPCTLPT